MKNILKITLLILLIVGCEEKGPNDPTPTGPSIPPDGNNETITEQYGYINGTCLITEIGKYTNSTVTVWADREIKYYGSMTKTIYDGSFNFKLDSRARYSIVCTSYYNNSKYKGTIQGIKTGASVFIPMQKTY